MEKTTHQHAWQLFLLADRLQLLIERSRLLEDSIRPLKISPCCKHDHYHRLFFCLQRLNNDLVVGSSLPGDVGNTDRKGREFGNGNYAAEENIKLLSIMDTSQESAFNAGEGSEEFKQYFESVKEEILFF